MADIGTLNTTEKGEQGTWMTVEDVYGDPFVDEKGKPVRIKLLGANSEAVKNVVRKQRVALMQHMRRNTRITDQDIAREEKNELEIAVAATVDWEGVELGGEKLECKKSNARKVYSVADLVLEQVVKFINDDANFMKGSSKA